jgi:hypothetical protein
MLWAETIRLPVMEDELVDGCMVCDEDHPLHDVADGDPIDKHFDTDDFTPDALRAAEEDCAGFFARLEERDLLERANEYEDDEQIAYDFWLTRNGHGAGFWDGDYADPDDGMVDVLGDELSAVANEFREQDVYVNEDGTIGIE